jgi:LmbE family N-acetylglucosaminyl deacetylase
MKFPPVQPFPDEAFTRVLCVVAHPDDVEYGTSSAVAAWTAKGIEVGYLLLIRGEAGIDTMDPKATAELRIREQIKGSHEVGVTQVDFLEYPDGVREYSILPVNRLDSLYIPLGDRLTVRPADGNVLRPGKVLFAAGPPREHR